MKRKTQVLVSALFILQAGLSMAQEERAMGMLIDREKDKAVPLVDKPAGFGANLPERVSLKEYVPAIGDQGNHGTCVGWSSTYYAASIEYARLKGITNAKQLEVNVYDPYYTYLGIVNNVDPSSYSTCESGTYVSDACEYLYDVGAKRMMLGQVSCGDDISSVHEEGNSMVDFTDYYRVYNWYDNMEDNVTAACQSLANNHPVVFGMYVPRSFFDISSDGLFSPTSEEQEDPVGTARGGHALCIVGYDDTKFGGSFLVVNSWGSSWGADGYFYLRYEDFQTFTTSAYSFETELKPIANAVEGCVYGDCQSGYGVMNVKSNGVYEGSFSNGEMNRGIYFNFSKKLFKGGKMFMKKTVKKSYNGTLLYDGYDYKKPIGFVLK